MKTLEVIRNNPNITKKQIQEKNGKSKTTVDNGISYLKENGIIEYVGSNKADYWKVLDGERFFKKMIKTAGKCTFLRFYLFYKPIQGENVGDR